MMMRTATTLISRGGDGPPPFNRCGSAQVTLDIRSGSRRWGRVRECAAALLLLAAAGGSALAQTPPKLLLLTEVNPPANFIDPLTGQATGLAVDKVRMMMDDAGVPYEIKVLPWLEGVSALDSTPNACIFLINLTEDRRPRYQWVGPLMEGGWALFAPLGFQRRLTVPADLAGLRIAVQAGGALEGHVLDLTRNVPGVTLVRGDAASDIAAIFNGQADLFAGGSWSVPFQARQAELPVRMVMRLTRSVGSLACNKQVPGTSIDRMQKALDRITEDGRGAAIERRYSAPSSWGSWGLDRRAPGY